MRFFVGMLEGWRHLDGDEERGAPQTRHLIGRRQSGERGEKSRMRRRPADGAQRAWANPARSGRRRPGALARAWRGRARRGRGGSQSCWPGVRGRRRGSGGGASLCSRRAGGEGEGGEGEGREGRGAGSAARGPGPRAGRRARQLASRDPRAQRLQPKLSRCDEQRLGAAASISKTSSR